MDFNQSCRGVFREMGIFTVYALYIYECVMFVCRNKSFFEDPNIHHHHTRAEFLRYPTHRLQLTKKGPHYMCVKLYNKLPIEIKRSENQRTFKRDVKKLLIQLEPYCLDDYINMRM